jgi:hypothetical protein|tara:strand:+ start:1179 stop:1361 length:183 start_codon:yes stop_codon:yes gene_type:complete
MSTKEMFSQMEELWESFKEEHSKFVDKGNKSAGTRARKSIGEIKKLVTEYRKASVEESKS